MAVSSLGFVWAAMEIEVDDPTRGGPPGRKVVRSYPDWTVDGRRLIDLLLEVVVANGYAHEYAGEGGPLTDFIPPIGWLDRSWQEWYKRVLLGEVTSYLSTGRQPLLVCAFDASPDCGVISVTVERDQTSVAWRDFGYEKENDEPADMEAFRGLGPFRFAPRDYQRVLDEVCQVVVLDSDGQPVVGVRDSEG